MPIIQTNKKPIWKEIEDASSISKFREKSNNALGTLKDLLSNGDICETDYTKAKNLISDISSLMLEGAIPGILGESGVDIFQMKGYNEYKGFGIEGGLSDDYFKRTYGWSDGTFDCYQKVYELELLIGDLSYGNNCNNFCTNCNICVKSCPTDAIKNSNGFVSIDTSSCIAVKSA